MTDPPRDDAPVPDDRTRDITLPPLPHRPVAALPREWAGLRATAAQVDAPTTAVPEGGRPPVEAARVEAARPPVEPVPSPLGEVDAADAEARRVAGRRTDEMETPPDSAARERTLAFSSPEMRHRSIEPVRVQATPRRWPWVVLTLIPVLMILGFGVAWLILLRGM